MGQTQAETLTGGGEFAGKSVSLRFFLPDLNMGTEKTSISESLNFLEEIMEDFGQYSLQDK